MTSPNLAVTHVAAAQNQKEVTINDAIDALDNAMNRALSVVMADADLTLTNAQANRNGLIILTGTLTESRTLTLPANHRQLTIRNACQGRQNIRVNTGSDTEFILIPGATVLIQGDGRDFYTISSGVNALAELHDVSVASAANNDVLQFNGAAWGPAGVGIFHRALLPFRGALLQRKNNFEITVTDDYVPVSWQATAYDSDAFWNPDQPSRLTIPAGVTKVRIIGNIEWDDAPRKYLLEVQKKGASVLGGGASAVGSYASYSNQMHNVLSAVLPVLVGDWFELCVYADGTEAIRGGNRTWLAIEVIETADASNPPADVSGYKFGLPAADEEMLRVPIARRTRLEINLAGSHASAEVEAKAQADFDIRVDGVSIGTMRFAAAAKSATFIAAGEIVLEPSQVLTVVAPPVPDATLKGIGFTLAGSRIL